MTVGEVRLGLIGLGTVGTGVVQLLERNHDAIARKLGRSLRLVRVASRSLDTKPHPDLGHAKPRGGDRRCCWARNRYGRGDDDHHGRLPGRRGYCKHHRDAVTWNG